MSVAPTAYAIAVQSTNQQFNVTLAGTEYQFTIIWRDAAGFWTLDIADSLGNSILAGIPLTTGLDLLAQYAYLDFGGALWVFTPGDPLWTAPSLTSLGDTCGLYFVPTVAGTQ